jgi:Protein of unknown function (DUF3667)
LLRRPDPSLEEPPLAAAAPWTCPVCNALVTTPYCARCGEEPVAPRELTLRGLAEKAGHALTSVDARAVRTTRCLLRHPGELTASWARGVRRPYVAPFQLFLLANAIFFGLQWLTGEIVLSSSLDSHLNHQDWSELARTLLARHLAAAQTTMEQFAPAFDRAVVLNAKSLIVLMTVPFALLLPLAFLRQRKPFMLHVVFSLHLYTFLLLLFCLGMVAAKLSALSGFGGLEVPAVDNVLSVLNLAACALYIHLAIGRVYDASGPAKVIQTFVLTILVAAIVIGYRFLLFLITLYAA